MLCPFFHETVDRLTKDDEYSFPEQVEKETDGKPAKTVSPGKWPLNVTRKEYHFVYMICF